MARHKLNRIERDKFYILTNGKQTEVNYFKFIKTKKSIYDVKIEFHNGDPASLIKEALKKHDVNPVWCVFDIDQFHKDNDIERIIKQAEDNNIRCAISNISFEVWILSHYEKVTNYYICKELIKKIELLGKIDYQKADEKFVKDLINSKLGDAILNAKIVHQKKLSETKVSTYPNCREKYGNGIRALMFIS